MRHIIEVIIGFSTDEMTRIREPEQEWKRFRFPLIDEINYRRADCLSYIESIGLPEPPKSACVFCPFRSNAGWKHLKQTDPDAFEAACKFDEDIRNKGGKGFAKQRTEYRGDQYVHRSLKPLREVDLKETQLSLFEDEVFGFAHQCAGHCAT